MSRIHLSSLPALSTAVLLVLFSLGCRGEVERADPGRPGDAAAETVPVRRAPAPPDMPRMPVEASNLSMRSGGSRKRSRSRSFEISRSGRYRPVETRDAYRDMLKLRAVLDLLLSLLL